MMLQGVMSAKQKTRQEGAWLSIGYYPVWTQRKLQSPLILARKHLSFLFLLHDHHLHGKETVNFEKFIRVRLYFLTCSGKICEDVWYEVCPDLLPRTDKTAQDAWLMQMQESNCPQLDIQWWQQSVVPETVHRVATFRHHCVIKALLSRTNVLFSLQSFLILLLTVWQDYLILSGWPFHDFALNLFF